MSFRFDFEIEELPDGKSFLYKDTTGNYNPVFNNGGWGSPNYSKTPMYGTEQDYYVINITLQKYKIPLKPVVEETPVDEIYTYEINTLDYSIDNLMTYGIEIFKNIDGGIFLDGAYKITVSLKTYLGNVKICEVTKNYGFYALTKYECMNQFLTYNPFLPRRTKELYWEKARILDNLYYAAETDQIIHFCEGLEYISKLK